ncbi:MAG: dTMP kinase [Candidatus Njordarchaeales archaeon]
MSSKSGGTLIVLEGIDGSGKSTQAKLLYDWLIKEGYKAVLLREPTNGKYGRILREKLKSGKLPPDEAYRLFLLDRIEDVQTNIIPALKKGYVVVIDRYFISTIAYQGASGIPIDKIISDHKKYGVPIPDIVFVLDIPADEAINRLKRLKRNFDSFEKKDFLEKVRKIYLNVGRYIPTLVIIVDATRNVKEVHELIINHVSRFLSGEKEE